MSDKLNYVTQIVCAYVSKNNLSSDQVLKFITELNTLFKQLEQNETELSPAVPIKKSITPEYLICLEDGKNMRVLTRYLKNKYNLTPEQYKAKWKLPIDYPMIAPNYSQQRSEIARKRELGKKN